MNKDRRIEAWTKWALEGTPESAFARLERGESYFRERLEKGDTTAVLGSLSSVGGRGQEWFYRRCFQGEETCWDDLPRYTTYEALRYSVQELKTIFDTAPFAIIVLDAIARGLETRAARLAQRLELRFRVGRKPSSSAPAPFAVALHHRFVGTEPDLQVLAPYDAIFAAWDSSDDYAAACRTCVEYHLDNGQIANVGNDEFSGLFALIPVEFAALTRVRDLHGLPTPTIEHPFFETPFAKYPEAAQRPYDARADSLYVAAVERVTRDAAFKDLELDLYEI